MYELASGDDHRIRRALQDWTVADLARLRTVVERLARLAGIRHQPRWGRFIPTTTPHSN
jgi:hypothetical protein